LQQQRFNVILISETFVDSGNALDLWHFVFNFFSF